MTVNISSKSSIFSRDIAHQITQVALVGVSSSLLFNRQIGLVCSLAQILFSSLSSNVKKEYWFSEKLCIEQIKQGCSYFKVALAMQACVGLFFLVSGIAFNQIPIQVLRFLIAYKPDKAFLLFIRACFVSPVMEGIYFRGFVTDSVRFVQEILSIEKSDSKIQKLIRNFFQSFAYGLYHCHPQKAMMNIYYIVSKGSLGFFLGEEVEKTKTLFKSTAIHSSIQLAVFARLLSFKR